MIPWKVLVMCSQIMKIVSMVHRESKDISAGCVKSRHDFLGIIVRSNFLKQKQGVVVNGRMRSRHFVLPWATKPGLCSIGQITYGLKYTLNRNKDGSTVIPVSHYTINHLLMKKVGANSLRILSHFRVKRLLMWRAVTSLIHSWIRWEENWSMNNG